MALARIIKRLDELGSISNDDQCLTRSYGTTAHRQVADLIKVWMQEAGLEVSIDNVGNIRGIIKSPAQDAKHFVIGSHYDTVYDAGKYDGPLGILLSIEMAQHVTDTKQQLPFHMNCCAFSDEEGCRFNTAYLGSSVIAGNFDSNWLSRQDDNGITLTDVIESFGGDVNQIDNDAIPAHDWLGYFEAHIEQGPVLCEKDLPVCLVNGIAAQIRINIKWTGESGHAGTSPMHLRHDALCAAAEFILKIEEIAKQHKDKLVATVGKLQVFPNTSNVIPGFINHTLDIRSPHESFLEEIVELLHNAGKQISNKRKIKIDWELMQSNPAINCDPQLQDLLARSIKKGNVEHLLNIPSGAGHDAVMISKVAPVSMLFVRCTDGVSHNPKEHVDSKDIAKAADVCNHFIDELINTHSS